MPNKNNDYSGCILPIVGVCGVIAIVMAFLWVTKGIGEIIKESPGGFFIVMVLITVIGIAWLNSRD